MWKRHGLACSAVAVAWILSSLPGADSDHAGDIHHRTVQKEYDFIIAGGWFFPIVSRRIRFDAIVGGTAGLVLANRLSESGEQRVLVLESGPKPDVVAAYRPAGGNQFLGGAYNELWMNTSSAGEKRMMATDV